MQPIMRTFTIHHHALIARINKKVQKIEINFFNIENNSDVHSKLDREIKLAKVCFRYLYGLIFHWANDRNWPTGEIQLVSNLTNARGCFV
jgi:hypothetical protein